MKSNENQRKVSDAIINIAMSLKTSEDIYSKDHIIEIETTINNLGLNKTHSDMLKHWLKEFYHIYKLV